MCKRSQRFSCLVALLLVLQGCAAGGVAPPSDFMDASLAGTWEVHYWSAATDRLVIRSDGTFQQRYLEQINGGEYDFQIRPHM
jgi:hypothetical protein